MYIRCAFFEGKVHAGREEEFSAFVRERLVPLWTQFPGAAEVRVLRELSADEGAPRMEMVLAISYPDLPAIDRAMASSARAESRAATADLIKMFDGRIFHTVFAADDFPLAMRG
jgi:hypothetical protein